MSEQLATRAAEATEPSRELDGEIMFDLFAKPVGKASQDGGPRGYLWPEDNPSWAFAMRFPGVSRDWFKRPAEGDERIIIHRDGAYVQLNSLRIPPITASIDAVTKLIDKVLPQAGYGVSRRWEHIARNPEEKCHGWIHTADETFEADARTPALALLSAFLKARAALQTQAGGE